MKAIAIIGLALAVAAPAQNLVKDPEFKDPKAWTIIGPPAQVRGWGPLHIRENVALIDDGKRCGVAQQVTIAEAGDYQMAVRADAYGTDGGVNYRVTLGPAVVLDGKVDPYSRWGSLWQWTIRLQGGTYPLTLSISGHHQTYPEFGTEFEFYAISLRKIALPSVDWRVEDTIDPLYMLLLVQISPPMDIAIPVLASHLRPGWLNVPGILGTFDLDPIQGLGLIILPPLGSAGIHRWTIEPWDKKTIGWPALHAQLLEIDFDARYNEPRFRFGSTSFTVLP